MVVLGCLLAFVFISCHGEYWRCIRSINIAAESQFPTFQHWIAIDLIYENLYSD